MIWSLDDCDLFLPAREEGAIVLKHMFVPRIRIVITHSTMKAGHTHTLTCEVIADPMRSTRSIHR